MSGIGSPPGSALSISEAFLDWQDGFDAQANAAAASRILQQLHAQTGDWNRAVALYHSADPERGDPYLRAVLSSWTRKFENNSADTTIADRVDPFTILAGPDLARIVVWAPNGIQGGLAPRRQSLPAVITP